VLQSDTDGYPIPNFRNFWTRIGYGYAKNFSDMNLEVKNQYPLTSAVNTGGQLNLGQLGHQLLQPPVGSNKEVGETHTHYLSVVTL